MKKLITILFLVIFNMSPIQADIASGFEDNTNFKNDEQLLSINPIKDDI
tara:strand:- start:220 stop:366 length:147 start_codon:yes stop_codon:yes gene_type:complete